jgi:fatty-acyl-CoA synthase
MTMGTVISWALPPHPRYLYTVPMFHCNGWGHAWTMTALAATVVCIRAFVPKLFFELAEAHDITHFGGAPIVLNMLANAPAEDQKKFEHKIYAMTAGAPPPAKVLESMAQFNFEVMHVYGLTETYGHILHSAPQDDWYQQSIERQAELKARQGVRFAMTEAVDVIDPESGESVPWDAETMGEIAVVYPDGYIQVRDRAKDVIISGGENISSVEVEGVLYKHPAVGEAAVVALADEKWGEVPCAFIELKAQAETSEQELIDFCANNMARFKRPKKVVFGELPKTATGKIQKNVLRERAKEL